MDPFIKFDLFRDGTLSPKSKKYQFEKSRTLTKKSKERTGGRNIENPFSLLEYVN